MVQIIFCLSIYILLALMLFIGCKPGESSISDDVFFRLNSLRGLFALEIIIGHCVRFESCLLTPLGNFMLISVGYFFFISGFGLARSFHTKQGYMDRFIKHRFLHLLFIAAIALIITTIIAYISPVKTDFQVTPSSLPILLLSIRARTNWYIRELIILYFVFYLCYRFLHTHKKTVLCLAIFSVCTVLFYLEYRYSLGYTRCWYASIVCFPLGIITYEYYDKIIPTITTAKGKMFSVSILLGGLILSLINYPSLTGLKFEITEMIYAFFNNILCIGFIAVLLIALLNLVPGNRILRFFTSISTEIYLFQFIFISIAEKMQLSYPWKIAFVLTLDIIVSVIVNRLIFYKPRTCLSKSS
ncbi:MAG: acyltransferase [Lachnospiraceae bacterium]|nr:acyltransferase [Lachnospiraceae bacterium]